MFRRVLASVLPLAIVVAAAGCSVSYRHEVEPAGTPASWQYDEGRFIRYDGYDRGETPVAGDLEISITDYRRRESPVVVRMVGVVHIADQDYYREIQGILDESDLVLYEGVNRDGQPGTVDPTTRALWDSISALLGFAAQTSNIRYDRANFKQCDLVCDPEYEGQGVGSGMANPEALATLHQIAGFKRQAEELYPMDRMEDYLKHMNAGQLIQAQGFNTEGLRQFLRQMRTVLEPMAAINEDAAALAEKLRELEAQLARMESLIIVERNQYVMKHLAEEVTALEGKGEEQVLSVFYGAGHMHDFDQRLSQAGWERGESRWLKAWKMNSR